MKSKAEQLAAYARLVEGGRKGGLSKSQTKLDAIARNAKLGGRPPKRSRMS